MRLVQDRVDLQLSAVVNYRPHAALWISHPWVENPKELYQRHLVAF